MRPALRPESMSAPLVSNSFLLGPLKLFGPRGSRTGAFGCSILD